jgi:drug/metabolite transporter (DMT)-like permease
MVFDCSLGAIGALFFKKSSSKIKLELKIKSIIDMLKNKNLIIGLFFYILGAALLTFLLKTENLSLIYPLTSMTYIFIVFLSVKFLNEKMNKYKWLAVFLIIVGNIFITI